MLDMNIAENGSCYTNSKSNKSLYRYSAIDHFASRSGRKIPADKQDDSQRELRPPTNEHRNSPAK